MSTKIDVFADPTTNELSIHIDGEKVYGITKGTPLDLPVEVEVHQPTLPSADPKAGKAKAASQKG